MYRILILAVFFLLVPATYAKSRDPLLVELPELEVIPGAEWYWVGQHMALNNIPMSIRMFTYPGAVENVSKYYTSKWQTQGNGKLSHRDVGDLKILLYDLNGFLYSVQLSQKSELVEGKLTVSPTPLNYKSNVRSAIAVAPSSKVASKVETLDAGRRSESLTIDSRLPWKQLENFYMTEFSNDDWSRYSHSETEAGSVTSFQRGGELLQLTIKGLQGRNGSFSQALIHWLK